MGGVLAYRRLASPLHAARAPVGAAWLASLAFAALLSDHPLLLAAIAAASLGAARAAGLGARLRGPLRLAAYAAVPIVVINLLVSRQGLTVFARLGSLGPFGQGDLTLQALVYGAVIAVKVSILIVLGAVLTLAVDPDELLALCGRVSLRLALMVSLALRMLPLLAADSQRLAEAQRTRPDGGVRGLRGRALLLGAGVGGALDRALEVAATLELRGFAGARRLRVGVRRPLSRHDLAFLLSAAGVLALALAGTITGATSFGAYPLIRCPTSVVTGALCVALVAVSMLPFLDRRGVR